LCTALAIWTFIEAPVEPAPRVSQLYVSAAVFVPLELWFGIFGVGALVAFGDSPTAYS